MATNYDINYNDERFTKVESDKTAALSDLEKTYAGMIESSDKYYQAQIDASKQWADKQTQLQNEKTDFAIEKIEQQKDQTKKDYIKEQSGAYVDWQKQSNQYGANSEKIAAGGLQNTGFAESSQVSMYNTYQNRVATARESYNQAVVNYNNSITEARLQNNSILAEIAYEALQQQLELSLQGFQYKNQLILEKTNKKTELDNIYYQRYQDVLKQINTENAMAEEVRQYNATLALQQAQLAEQQRQFDAQMAARNSGGGGGGGSNSTASSKAQNTKSQLAATANKATNQKNTSYGKAKDTSEVTWNAKSLLALGYGPISGAKAEQLAEQGLITVTQKGNQLYAKKKEVKSKADTFTSRVPTLKLP
jgi:hypothetical protein